MPATISNDSLIQHLSDSSGMLPLSAQVFYKDDAKLWQSFVISTMTFAMVMMGWGGASGLSPVVYVLHMFLCQIAIQRQQNTFTTRMTSDIYLAECSSLWGLSS